MVENLIRLSLLVDLEFEHVHVDVRTNQVVLSFLNCLALEGLLLCERAHLDVGPVHAAHVLNEKVPGRSHKLEDDPSDVDR